VLKYDATNVEAIACIATHYFYSEQPEMALRYYRYCSIQRVVFGNIHVVALSSPVVQCTRSSTPVELDPSI